MAAGSLSVTLLVVAALIGTAIVAAILAVSGATDVRVGAALVIAVVGLGGALGVRFADPARSAS